MILSYRVVREKIRMAGAVRQHIDVASLSRYLGEHVADIRLPIDLQQVPLQTGSSKLMAIGSCAFSSAMGNPTRHT